MKKALLIARLLEQFSAEDGLNYITGSRLTMKPLAGPMPRRVANRPATRPKARKKHPAAAS